jgi:hypothetical protein
MNPLNIFKKSQNKTSINKTFKIKKKIIIKIKKKL